ncbi:hypothetical protein NTH_00591 [Nitratireductor thuwali]|uniref:Uncharacterized protein n=1 Tax=Nitratireductor thuwali TaxID=2267699 RepID=A0ABY5MFX3_9HYPH|nr:hypothetical protein NTH_00591 [Nitratireductor thuwali]
MIAGVVYPTPDYISSFRKIASRSVSRVLYGCSGKRCNVATIPLGPVSPPASSDLPERQGRKQPSKVALRTVPIRSCSRWGLPCRPCCQARGGLLPHPFTLTPRYFGPAPCIQGSAGHVRWTEIQAGRFAFCGTFPGVAPAGCYPAPCFRGARTFLTHRLSALERAAARPAGAPYKGIPGAKCKPFRAYPRPRIRCTLAQ